MVMLLKKLIFLHKLLLIDTQFANLRIIKSSTNMNLSKTQLSKMIKSGGFLGRLLLLKIRVRLRLIKNVIQPSAKSVLIRFWFIIK